MTFYLFWGFMIVFVLSGGLFVTTRFYKDHHIPGMGILTIGSAFMLIISMVAMFSTLPIGYRLRGAEVRAELYNNKYGTSYTAEQVFFAPDLTIKEPGNEAARNAGAVTGAAVSSEKDDQPRTCRPKEVQDHGGSY